VLDLLKAFLTCLNDLLSSEFDPIPSSATCSSSSASMSRSASSTAPARAWPTRPRSSPTSGSIRCAGQVQCWKPQAEYDLQSHGVGYGLNIGAAVTQWVWSVDVLFDLSTAFDPPPSDLIQGAGGIYSGQAVALADGNH
jgi:hypothetical protein